MSSPPAASSLAVQLDAALLEAFAQLQNYTSSLATSNRSLQNAFFDLSQAKKSVGPTLGPISYDYRMCASKVITLDNNYQPEKMVLESLPLQPATAQRKNSGEDAKKTDKTPPAPRSIKKQDSRAASEKAKDSKGHTEQAEQQDDDDEEEERVPVNALSWFGVLTPATLRSSQSGFATALDHIVAAANAKRRLMDLESSYRRVWAERQHELHSKSPLNSLRNSQVELSRRSSSSSFSFSSNSGASSQQAPLGTSSIGQSLDNSDIDDDGDLGMMLVGREPSQMQCSS
ncbi:hypothetical protein RI367_008141 [Sorochytrium milnesiophthora]